MSFYKKLSNNFILCGFRSLMHNGLQGTSASRSHLHVLSRNAPSTSLMQAGTGFSLVSQSATNSIFGSGLQQLLTPFNPLLTQVAGFKVKGRLRRRCKDCYFVRRQERLYVICPTYPRHKQMAIKKREHNSWILTHATQSKIRPY